MYVFTFRKCPQCQLPFEVDLFGLSSGLGSPVVRCSRCQSVVATNRHEWPFMPIGGKMKFAGMTLIYVLAVAVLSGNFVDTAIQLWTGGETQNLRIHEPSFHVFAVTGAVAVITVQALRIVFSMQRNAAAPMMTTRDFWLGLEMNLQVKFLAVLVFVFLVATVKSRL